MSKEVRYFMDTEEIVDFLNEVCIEKSLLFYSGKLDEDGNIESYEYMNIPHLGKKLNGDHQTEFYYVFEKDSTPFSEIKLNKAGEKYLSLNQEGNKDSIVLYPGGRYDDNCLIEGHFSTIHSSKESLELMKCFESKLRKICKKKVRSWYLSDNAISYNNRLITVNVKQDKAYDLKISSK